MAGLVTGSQLTAMVVPAIIHDPELDSFLNGKLPEPQDRVGRKGAPDNRVQYRSSSQIWKQAASKITRLAQINIKAKRFNYEKKPLSEGHIRLLRIRPGRPEANVECDLCAKPLEQVRGKYEALSYCWGSEQPSEIVYINRLELQDSGSQYEQLPRQEFPVRPNLLKALRHLRRRDKAVLIWVDAICINQRETPVAEAEKNRQLSIMSDIYNSAKNVCIWLGDADNTSTAAWKVVNDITNFQLLDVRLGLSSSKQNDSDMSPIMVKGWFDLIRTLRESQWFSRRWIIQEIASARYASVHCGDDVVHWDDLADAISLLHDNLEILKRQYAKYDDDNLLAEVPTLSATHLVKALTNVCRKSTTGAISEKLLDLETLVCTFGQFQARFPQDVIHSVRALATDAPSEDEDGFGFGVGKKKSTRDLFIAFVKRCIEHSGSLDIICRHWAPPVFDSLGCAVELPSWISDLSNSPFGLPGEARERQNGENFVALSSHDKRKKYSASLDWGRTKQHTSTAVKRPRVEIPPSVTDELHPSPRKRRFMFNSEITASPSAIASDLGGDDGYFPPLADILAIEADKEFNPNLPNGVPGQATSTARAAQAVGDTNTLSKNSSTTQATVENPVRMSQNLGVPVSVPPGPFRRRKSRNLSRSDIPEKSPLTPARLEKAEQMWDVVADAALFPGSLRTPNVTRTSRSREESWTVHDKEHIQTQAGELQVYGFLLGTITQCSDRMRDGIVPGDWLARLGWNRDSHQNTVPDMLWRTLVADRNPDGGTPPTWYKRACLHCLRDTRITNTRGDLNSHKVHKVAESMTSMYLKRVESVIWRRRVIAVSSDEGPAGTTVLYGLAPEKTRENDVVCILSRCSVPVVMRPLSSNGPAFEGKYEFLGEAYVHGKMDGEAVRGRSDDPQRAFRLL